MSEDVAHRVRPVEAGDRAWIDELITREFGAPIVVSRGQVHRPSELDGFIAEDEPGQRFGLITLHVEGDACEAVTVNSLVPGVGVGRTLLAAAERYARERGCRRLWLITTNDNTRALRFYQRSGMRLVAVRLGAVDEARRIKPEIPLTGEDGIPIRDEIELAIEL